MSYVLNLNEENRVLSVANNSKYLSKDMPRVAEFPEGNVSDYRYVDGKYIYEPEEMPEENTIDSNQ